MSPILLLPCAALACAFFSLPVGTSPSLQEPTGSTPASQPATQDPAPAASAAPKWTRADLQKLGWLVGTWAMKDGEVVTEEHWEPLQGSSMLGTSHTFRGERTLAFEFLRLSAARDTIGYVAMPGGKAATTFRLATLADGVAEFTNAEHDYPQKIRYERTEKGVTATISLFDGGKAQAFVFERVVRKP